MTPDYLTYPNRTYGQDHALYDWRYTHPDLEWEQGALALSIIVPLEFFPLNPSGVPFKHPGAMATPYPDLRHYTVRDYGNRVGVFRLLEAFDKAGITAGFAINSKVAERYPPLIEAIRQAGHEITAHGVSTDHIHHDGLSDAEEHELIAQTQSTFPNAKGWLSPARAQSSRTPHLLAEAGYAYTLDWEMDSQPVQMTTDHGPLTAIPLKYELSDFTLLHTRKQSEEAYKKQILDAVDYLIAERSGQSLAIRMTPYIMGQPFRQHMLRDLLAELNQRDVWITSPGNVATAFQDQL
jgi:peptidoglycan/xylan/chitin deacetylase (PgdA/CDA1 family)